MTRSLAALLLVWVLIAASGARPETEPQSPAEVISRVKAVYEKHCCFRARFDQVTVNVAMDMRDRFLGNMYVRKPHFIALDVESPEKQKVVMKARSYMVYFPEDGNAVRGEVPPELNVELFFGFLANVAGLDRLFVVSYPPKSHSPEENLILLELTEKKNLSSAYRIVLGIDSTKYIIRRAIIHDALGNYNRYDLSDITFPDSIPDSVFRIDYPHGTPTDPPPAPASSKSDRK